MFLRHLAIALAPLTLVACTRAPEPTSTEAIASAAAPARDAQTAPSTSSSAAVPPPACDAFAAEQGPVLAAIRAGASPDVRQALDGLPKVFGRCLPDPKGGAWGVFVEELCEIKPLALVNTKERTNVIGRWSVVRVDAAGKTTRPLVFPAGERVVCKSDVKTDELTGYTNILGTPATIARLRFEEPVVFDYDGDGRAELVLRIEAQRVDYSPRGDLSYFVTTRGATYTVQPDGRLGEYSKGRFIPGGYLTGSVDLDRDGRPDLFKMYPYGLPDGEGWTGGIPRLFARSRPDGTISIQDAAAIETTLAQCGPPEQPILAPDQGPIDEQASLVRLVCRALRQGAEPATEALQQACAKRRDPACKRLLERANVLGSEVPHLVAPSPAPKALPGN